MIVLDANMLIALDPHDPHHGFASAFVTAHSESPLVVNVVTLSEALVHPVAAGVGGKSDSAFRRLGLRVVGIPDEAALDLAELRNATGLRMPDALVVWTAEALDAELATTDARLARAAASRGLTVHTD